MKITKRQLKQIVKEELQAVLQEASMGAFARTDPDLVEESDIEEDAIRAAWTNYCHGTGTRPGPDVPPPENESLRACAAWRDKADNVV